MQSQGQLIHEDIIAYLIKIQEINAKPNRTPDEVKKRGELENELFEIVKDHPQRFEYIKERNCPRLFEKLPPLQISETIPGQADYPKEVYVTIERCYLEIEKWFDKIPFDLEPDDNEQWLEKLQDNAVKAFSKGKFKTLKKEWINNNHLWITGSEKDEWNSKKRRGGLIGRLCQVIISREHADLLPDLDKPSDGYGAKTLYSKVYRKIRPPAAPHPA